MKKDKTKEAINEIALQFTQELRAGSNPFSAIASANPFNWTSGKTYGGFNRLYLSMKAKIKGYSSDAWTTFEQAKAKGESVNKGEKGEPIFFWGTAWAFTGDVLIYGGNTVEEAIAIAKKKGITPGKLLRKSMFLKSSTVFNTDQTGFIIEPTITAPSQNIKEIVATSPITWKDGLPRFDGSNVIISENFDFNSNGELALLPVGEWISSSLTEGMSYPESQLTAALAAAFLANACGLNAPMVAAEIAAQIADALTEQPMALYYTASKAEKAVLNLLEMVQEARAA